MVEGVYMDVVCPGCSGIYHETTEHFTSDQPAHGGMFRLKKKYRAWGWDAFPADAAIRFADLECPWCGSCYVTPGGRLAKPLVGMPDKDKKDEDSKEVPEGSSYGPIKKKEPKIDKTAQQKSAKKAGTAKKKTTPKRKKSAQ